MSGNTAHKPGSLSTLDRKKIVEYSPYITLSQVLFADRLSLSAGLRMANSDKFDTQWVPQFGFSINPGLDWTVKGNLAMGYRNPSFRELYLYRMANPDLNPEKMMNYELTVGRSFSRLLTAELTAYYSRGSNMIQVLDQKNRNTGRFINKGIELTLHSNPLDNLWLNASYSLLHTSLDNLAGAPRNQYFVGAEWRPLRWLDITADVKGVAGLFVSDGINRQNYALLHVKASFDVCRYLALFVDADNLTDARYTINRGYTMPGITALGGFRLSL